MEITSIQNAKVKEWAKLKEKKYRDKEGLFLIEGEHLVEEALKKGLVTELIGLTDAYKNFDIPFYQVNSRVMDKLTSQVTSSKVIAVTKKLKEEEIMGNVCILDGIQDPGNLGTIIRSAVAFGFKTIILSNEAVDLYNDKVIRASEGMIFNLNFRRGDLTEILPILKAKGYSIYGTDVVKGESIDNLVKVTKIAIIIGNEGKGISLKIKEYCDNFIYIPISKECESLNAGVAAGIIMYELGSKN